MFKPDWKQWVMAWINKYILHIASPSTFWLGYRYEWDMFKDRKRFNKVHGHYIEKELRKWALPEGGDKDDGCNKNKKM